MEKDITNSENPATTVSTAEIENFLIRRMGEQEGREIINYIHSEIDKKANEKVAMAQNEIATWRSQMKNDFYSKEDGLEMQKKLTKRVSSVEGTIILWGFVFWITTILAIYIIYKFVI